MNTKLTGKKIFIVEDNTMNRVVYTMALKLSGAVIEFDIWGRETVARLKGFQPDLIILDLMLSSTTSGFDVFEDIRAQPDYSHVPIVAISASEPAIALPKCQKMGFTGFIAKPIDEEVLPSQVLRLIEGEQVWYLGERYGGEA
jgi:CheY-like chemotaxis protein